MNMEQLNTWYFEEHRAGNCKLIQEFVLSNNLLKLLCGTGSLLNTNLNFVVSKGFLGKQSYHLKRQHNCSLSHEKKAIKRKTVSVLTC